MPLSRNSTAPPPWKRRPIFLWQLRFIALTLFLTLLLNLPPIPSPNTPSLPNPCLHRPPPPPLPPSPPPTLFFPHIPKTAGTNLYPLLFHYANRTNSLPCHYPLIHHPPTLSNFTFSHPDLHTHPNIHTAHTPPPPAPQHPLPRDTLAAILAHDPTAKQHLLVRGGCRSLHGHVPFTLAQQFQAPVFTILLLRHPLARFVSMYEYARAQMTLRPHWAEWLSQSDSLAAEFANSTSIVHWPFVDAGGRWIERGGELSFGFYGALYQLSGIVPRFVGVADPYHFGMENGKEMMEKAKDHVCTSHVVGVQEEMPAFWRAFWERLGRWCPWTEDEKSVVEVGEVNKTPGRLSRNIDDHLPPKIRDELEQRLREELEVYEFARSVAAYRRALRDAEI